MKANQYILACAMIVTAMMAVAPCAKSQVQTTGTPGSPSATTTINGSYLPPPDPKFGGVINMSAKDSKSYWPPTVVPPKGAPNILLIMTDDQGYAVSGTFGGVIPTPVLDRVAKAGLRYTQFHTTSLCSPTRAALITGRNHHSVGFGVIAELSTGYPGYDAVIEKNSATVGEILKENGYATSWFGKNHNTPSEQYSTAGPFDQWPIGMGFDYFYGFLGGETDQWTPWLFKNTTQIFPWVGKPGYNLITDMADDAIKYLKDLNDAAPDKPFFLYYVPGGSHAPHQPTPEWIKKISDMHLFDKGWNDVRDQILANQKRLGVVPANTQLTPWPDGQAEFGGAKLAKWDTLSADEKKLFLRQADVFGAYTAYTDYEIGRVIQAVQDMGKLDNTLIIFIVGDNGTSAEGSILGTPVDMAAIQGVNVPVADQLKFYDVWGSDKTTPHMAVGWTWAFDTPFKWTKQVASHFGGTRNGLVISWPGHIKDVGAIRTQFHHVIDIVPTILEATGIQAPLMVNGIAQKPIEGVSMVYTFDPAAAGPHAPSRHETQYFEMVGNRAIYHDGWIAATTPPEPPWSLGYGQVSGRSQRLQLGALQPRRGLLGEQRPRRQESRQAARHERAIPVAGSEIRRVPTGQQLPYSCVESTAELYGGKDTFHLLWCIVRVALQRCPRHRRQVLHHHRRGGNSRRRRGGGNGQYARRSFRWLRSLLAQGQTCLHLQPARFGTFPLGRPSGAYTRQTHHRV